MAEFQTLFHNPESLNDADLADVKRKIQMQRITPWVWAGAFTFATFTRVKALSIPKLAPAFALGYFAGGVMSYHLFNGKPSNCEDKEILNAFESRYAEKSLNACGYGNNALNMASHTKEKNVRYKRPY